MLIIIYWLVYFYEYSKEAVSLCSSRTPAMIGCSFVVDREYFGQIGLLDPGMEVYGGENIELGMRVGTSVFLFHCRICTAALVLSDIWCAYTYFIKWSSSDIRIYTCLTLLPLTTTCMCRHNSATNPAKGNKAMPDNGSKQDLMQVASSPEQHPWCNGTKSALRNMFRVVLFWGQIQAEHRPSTAWAR